MRIGPINSHIPTRSIGASTSTRSRIRLEPGGWAVELVLTIELVSPDAQAHRGRGRGRRRGSSHPAYQGPSDCNNTLKEPWTDATVHTSSRVKLERSQAQRSNSARA